MRHCAQARPSRQRGQALVEFSLVSMLVFTLMFGIMDWSYFFSGKVSATNAARSAARYAAVHPTAWTNANPPAANTIESRLVLTAVPATVVNQDYVSGATSYITISYLIPSTTGGTTCGQYSVNANGFVGAPISGGGTYTQAQCVVAGNIVTVEAVYTYRFITPFLQAAFSPGTIQIRTEAAELIEV